MSDELKAVGRFLKEAPPGEYEDCVQAIKGFIEDESVLEEGVKLTKEEWLLNNCTTINIDDHKAILCEEARKGEGKFVDPVTNKVFSYDFIEQKIIESAPKKAKKPADGEEEDNAEEDKKEEEEQNEEIVESSELRKAIQPLALAFASSTVHNGTCGTYDSEEGVKIVVRASSISKPNFRTGIILMHFTCHENTIKGTIELRGHFYEHGNCVGNQKAEFEDSYTGDDEEAQATDIVKKMSKFFNKWNSAVAESFELLNSEGLNKLRRRLPISVQKINWAQELRGLGAMPGQK
jgi:capping protein alpha